MWSSGFSRGIFKMYGLEYRMRLKDGQLVQ